MREWLKEYRLKKRLSQNEVAKLCGISQQCYFFYENGDRRPTPENAKRIAKILGFKWTKFYQ